ncbi:hypothetical protein HY419_01055, partial [candidate division WWE3 bacterium]|nr:hypothetical protein [candidate division WWE3 bacterium]
MFLRNFNAQGIIDGVFIVLYFIIFIALLYLLLSFAGNYLKLRKRKKDTFNLTFFLVKIPELNEIEIKVAEQMFASLYSIKKGFFQTLFSNEDHVSFEIVAKESAISFYVSCPKHLETLVEKQINAAYPVAEIEIVKPPKVWDRGSHTSLASLVLAGAPYYPIRTFE